MRLLQGSCLKNQGIKLQSLSLKVLRKLQTPLIHSAQIHYQNLIQLNQFNYCKMSEKREQKKQQKKNRGVSQLDNQRVANPETNSPGQPNSGNASESGRQQDSGFIQMTYEEAQQNCLDQMAQVHAYIENKDLSPEQKQKIIQDAQVQCEEYLEKIKNQQIYGQESLENQQLLSNMSPEYLLLCQQQQAHLTMQQLTAQAEAEGTGLPGTAFGENGVSSLNGMLDSNGNAIPATQAYQMALLQQHMLQNYSPQEAMAQAQHQYEMRLKMEMGNQLRIFAMKMFRQVNKRQKKKLETKARQYLDQYSKDQKKLQNSKGAQSELDLDFEFSADPVKYLNEIKMSVKKDKSLNDNFKRFLHIEFDDNEQDLEQVSAQFFMMNPLAHQEYMHYLMLYDQATDDDDKKRYGDIIFNIIMPKAHEVNPILLKLIPEKTKQQFHIEFEENGQIKSWELIERDSDDSDSEGSSDENSRDSASNLSSSSPQHDKSLTSSDNEEGESSIIDGYSNQSIQMEFDATVPDNDMSQITSNRGGTKKKTPNGMPQHHLTGKHKSLINQLIYSYPHQKNINKHELKPLDNFFRSIRDEKDWMAFCKLLYLYFEGVLSLKEFFQVYDEKFQQKLKQEIKDEMDKLLPTRDINRRNLSNLLKAWNDTENTTFEKVADSSYYKIDEGFPIPTCTMKMTDEVYWKNLNDIYLSLATGSENKKFRNTNEDKIYTIEDKMYEYDTQIDNIQKSYNIVCKQVELFETLTPAEQALYKFPVQKLQPLRFYWDKKFKKLIHDQYFDGSKVLKTKEMSDLKKQFTNKLEFLENQKKQMLPELTDQFRKNFTKSLDHKSFQFKDFMKKYLQKQTHIQKIRQIADENACKRRYLPHQRNILYGSGDQPYNSDYQFFNTFGKDFGGNFDKQRLVNLEKVPDYPIDMKFFGKLSNEIQYQNQEKCPQARFLFNDTRSFEITLKLIIQNAKNSNQVSTSSDKQKIMSILKFMMKNILMINNFEQIELSSDNIQPLTIEMVEILMSSALYYQKKYDGELDQMSEVFTADGLSTKNQSPLKESQQQQINQADEQMSKIDLDDCKSGESAAPKVDSDQFKELKIKSECEINQDLQSSIFIPKYIRKPDQPEENQYKLYYGPSNAWMFLILFYSVYERVLKAQTLVRRKVEQDFKEDFSKKQWSTKFERKQQHLIDERFQYLIKAILTAMTNSNYFDTNKYEDVARELLGNEAYLLFQVDKVVNNCVKHLIQFNSDQSCQVSQELFKDFECQTIKSEAKYLANFYHYANKCSIQSSNQGPQATGAAACHKDPPMNQQAYRFMFSPICKIMTVHNVILNPFCLSENRVRRDGNVQPTSVFPNSNGGISQQEYIEFLKEITTTRQGNFYEEEPKCEAGNKVTQHDQPVFLNRNLRKMKEVRKNSTAKVQKNGLVTYMIPLLQQMQFKTQTEDVFIISRKNSSMLGKRKNIVSQDIEVNLRMREKVEKRIKTIEQDQEMEENA